MSNTPTLYRAYYPNTYHVPLCLRGIAREAKAGGRNSITWTQLEQELAKPVKHLEGDYGDLYFYEDMYR